MPITSPPIFPPLLQCLCDCAVSFAWYSTTLKFLLPFLHCKWKNSCFYSSTSGENGRPPDVLSLYLTTWWPLENAFWERILQYSWTLGTILHLSTLMSLFSHLLLPVRCSLCKHHLARKEECKQRTEISCTKFIFTISFSLKVCTRYCKRFCSPWELCLTPIFSICLCFFSLYIPLPSSYRILMWETENYFLS